MQLQQSIDGEKGCELEASLGSRESLFTNKQANKPTLLKSSMGNFLGDSGMNTSVSLSVTVIRQNHVERKNAI